MSKKAPDWLLERVLLEEAPRRFEPTAETRARLEALEQSNAAILAALPPAAVAAEIRARSHQARKSAHRRRAAVWSTVAAMATVALVVMIREGNSGSPGVTPENEQADVTRAKGIPHLVIHRQRQDHIELLAPGKATARAGDRLQLSYLAAGKEHGVVLSIDGAGVVTLHFPEIANGSTRIREGGAIALGHSYELDDAPGFERFLFITAAEPIDVGAVIDSAEKLARQRSRASYAPLSLDPGLHQWSVTLDKEDNP